MQDDAQLLRQYVETGSEPAFRELVERHIQLVNSTARRMVAGDAHLAQDVTQLVFTDLARKAAALPPGVVLGGWLHRHTCFTAAKAVRTEVRRRARERTAMELNAINDQTGADAHWAQVAPVLDDALNRLDAPDRDAIVLRFLQQRDLRSVGQALGTSDDTAQKRVSRALEKLRGLLTNHGVAVSSVAVLASTLDAATIMPVTPGLATTISAHALTAAATAAGTGITLATIKTMITSKLALGLAATVLAAGVTIAVINHNQPAPATPGATPVAQTSASTPAPAVKTRVPQISYTGKVEAPKAAPAPAGDKPATPDDIAASANNQGGFVMTMSPNASNQINGSAIVKAGVLTFATGSATSSRARLVTPAQVAEMANNPGGLVTSSVQVANGQVTMITTKDGVTTTTTRPANLPGNAAFSSPDGSTMTITMPDGTTQVVPIPTPPVDNGDGTVTITLPDGTTQTVSKDSSGATVGGGVVIINPQSQP